ncbi:MAG: threonine-phosphate decarboxylase [Magnetococcales bacterium]|nr:threonine-phosphate decarboxylase [Magnetococcales bacterium]
MLEHGGGVRAAAVRFAIPPEQWLDLSTGVNPFARLPEAIPAPLWNRLPEAEDGLEAAARAYYGTPSLLPTAGSQAVIQALPRLRPPGRVAVLHPAYAEHAHAWRQAGHAVANLPLDALEASLESFDAVTVVHPNNPTGQRLAPERLLEWRERLARRGGWVVVDEAFIDPTPELSLAPWTPLPGLRVLRSLGKFFGLAGARVGFLLAEPELLARCQELLGPWSVAGPSRWAARQALEDRPWQGENRLRLAADARRLAALLARWGLPPAAGTDLFQWVPTPAAPAWWEGLARRGILVRRFDDPSGLRFGLPGPEADWRRLADALAALQEALPPVG